MIKKEVFKDITDLTSKIQNHYPELLKYLEEMPNTIPNSQNDDEEEKLLLKYKNSLAQMIANYKKETI